MTLLSVTDLHASVGEEQILKGLSLSVQPGEVHAIMGPNGSGKSTLANVLAGKDGYTVTSGTMTYNDGDISELEPHERAQQGIFLAFQYPVEIPGVSNMEFLKASVDSIAHARGEEQPNTASFIKQTRELAQSLDLNPEFLKVSVAARRSATKSCSFCYSIRSLRFWTKPTLAWTSMPSRWLPTG